MKLHYVFKKTLGSCLTGIETSIHGHEDSALLTNVQKQPQTVGLRLNFVFTAWALVQVHANEAGRAGMGGASTFPVPAWVFAGQNFCSKCSTWLDKQAIYKGPGECKRLKCEC